MPTGQTIAPPIAVTRIRWGMFFGGFSAFTLLYACQPLMPMLAIEFNLTATQASWVLSISMIALAISLLVISFLSSFVNHVTLMSSALLCAAIAMLCCATSDSFNQLLGFRALLGIALGGLPAVAATFLSQQIERGQLPKVIGFYIAGTALGGMTGRIIAALLSELLGWRATFVVFGVLGCLSAFVFIKLLALAEKNVTASFNWNFLSAIGKTLNTQLQQPIYWALFAIGFFLTGSFTGLFNYINFRLQQSPYEISLSALSGLTLLYIFGIWSSFCSAKIVEWFGYAKAISGSLTFMLFGLWITGDSDLILIIIGISIFTFGFFLSHTLCSSYLASLIHLNKSIITAMYLFCYYLGSSLLGSYSGMAWQAGGWQHLTWLLSLFLAICIVVSRVAFSHPAGLGKRNNE